jgi:zinc transport system ATP-binding protein
MTILDIRHATIAYEQQPILRDVSMSVAAGEVVAVLGANGTGKSTLIKAALGIVPLTAGQVYLFDTPIKKFRQWWRIGYVPQRMGAGSGVPATVAEVVASGRLARRRFGQPGGTADRQAVQRALVAVGLAQRSGEPVSTLSGGQQQRTLIARALAGQPDMLVLDEPTAGVDSGSQQAFADALHEFVHGGGTVILVAHELGPLEPLISRAVVLHGGRIVHDGPPPEPAGHHADPDHDHVHPHAPVSPSSWWSQP